MPFSNNDFSIAASNVASVCIPCAILLFSYNYDINKFSKFIPDCVIAYF